MLINTLARETLVKTVRDIAAKPHPMSSEIQGEAVLLEGQLDRFEGSTVGDIRQGALATAQAESDKAKLHRNTSRMAGAAALVSATASLAGTFTGIPALTIGGLAGFVGAGAMAVVYDHTSSLYSNAAEHTGATVARLDRWAGYAAAN